MNKKLIIMLATLFAILIIAIPSFAEDDGYIFRLKKDTVMLFSENENVSRIGGDVYYAKSMEDIYKFTSEVYIESVIPNFKLELYDIDYPTVTSDTKYNDQWNHSAILANVAREKGLSGKGVKIGIIDSGVDTSHPDIDSSKILKGYNCIEDDPDEYNTTDIYGHGTNVCGIISAITDNEAYLAGIAPNASIVPLKVTNGSSLSAASLFGGIYMAIEYDCDIINMSLGGNLTDEYLIAELKYWIDMASDAGIIIIAAGGNEDSTAISYPAGFDNVIGVASVKKDLSHSKYSQRNESIFISAPGHGVTTLEIGDTTSSEIGTSIATPHITAIVALIKEVLPDATLSDVKDILKSSSTDLGDEGYDTTFGYGLISVEKVAEHLSPYLPDVVISDGIKDGITRIHIHNNGLEIKNTFGYFREENASSGDGVFYCLNKDIAPDAVTTFSPDRIFSEFLWWDENMKPFIKKYIIQ